MIRKLFTGIAFLFMLNACVYQASEFEEAATVKVQDKQSYLQLDPIEGDTATCFIFYPGGLVDPEAYISSMQMIAENGYRVLIIKATGDLAIFNIKRASKIIENFPEVKHWIVGGHSLGGVVAIKAVALNPELYEGLVLLAAYPAENDDLSDWQGAALSLSAENDGYTLPSDIEAGKDKLPQEVTINGLDEFPEESTLGSTIYYEIPGANHSQFGDYGFQKNDGDATITREEQHRAVQEIIEQFFKVNRW